jgi:predicted unusual protein kinase regulating ubiquinone biosynthesis (AarF/ABC1/UbiB family)
MAPLMGLAARTAAGAAAARLIGRPSRAEHHARTAERYAELLGQSKGVLMKAGQMLSFTSAGPVVPAELQSIYQTTLSRLRSDAPPMARTLARSTLEGELGRPAKSVFAEFDWIPLAAASVGQVHAARLHDGRAVAVKIQYPGVADAIAADLENTELLATFLSLTVGGLSPRKLRLDFRGMAGEMHARIAEEVDYRLEAANQAEFADRYRGHPFIHVPDVIDELCTGRVLTQELVRGLSWDEALIAGQEQRDRWAEAIHRFAYGSYGRFCMFNADPHPGNYLFHEDGSVSFLDFGCVKRLRREQVEIMDAVVAACLHHDVLGTWRASVEAGFWRSSDPVTPEEAFRYWRDDWAMIWAEQRFAVTPEYVDRWVERKFSPAGPSANALRYITIPPEYTLIGRLETGLAAVVAQLHASARWGSMAAERFDRAAPLTDMGRRDHEFFESRPAASHA